MNGNLARLKVVAVLVLVWGLYVGAAPASAQPMCHYTSLVACYDAARSAYAACQRAIPPVSEATCHREYDEDAADCEDTCGIYGPDGEYEDAGNGTPIVIDLGPGALAFTAPRDGVFFDLDGDGAVERVAWTYGDSGDGFLVLDRDLNGTIDSGQELFGDHTVQPVSREPNGFRALAVFDTAKEGGNADGLITGEDRIWRRLRVWVDVNHDGLSQAEELAPLAAHKILSIDLDYRRTNQRLDGNGNDLRYRTRVMREGRPTIAVDVFLNLLH